MNRPFPIIAPPNENCYMTAQPPTENALLVTNGEDPNAPLNRLPAPARLYAVVSAREQLGAVRIRLTFAGADVAAFIRNEAAARTPGTWIKLFVPCANGDSIGRAYTLRQFDLGKGSFDIDFVIHETGPLSSWARTAQPGDAVTFTGPRDGGFALRPESQWIALIGDETGLPAIQAILANVPSELPGIVLIETDHPGTHEAFFVGPNIELSWVRGTQGWSGAIPALVEALDRQETLPGPGQAWVAGEASSVMAVRTLLLEKWKLDKIDIRTKGYWKRGIAHFRS